MHDILPDAYKGMLQRDTVTTWVCPAPG